MIDQPETWIVLFFLGTFTGAIAGVLGIGGGLLMVPALTFFHVPLVQAISTSLVGVFLSAVSGSVQNWRKGNLNLRNALGLAIFGIPAAQVGAWLGDRLLERLLAFSFAALMVVTIYFLDLKQKLKQKAQQPEQISQPEQTSKDAHAVHGWVPVVQIGLLAGLLSGLFGIGGGTVMVPLQMLMLGESIKVAVRTSLGAIVPIAASGLAQHTWNGNVLWVPGICLGVGGILGAQLGTRLLPRLSDRQVNVLFRLLLLLLAVYMVWKGINTGGG
jgi:uncharacterized membrane protein YfcA